MQIVVKLRLTFGLHISYHVVMTILNQNVRAHAYENYIEITITNSETQEFFASDEDKVVLRLKPQTALLLADFIDSEAPYMLGIRDNSENT